MGKGSDPVTGYRYGFGIHMGIGRGPINSIIAAKVGDKLAWQGEVTASGDININSPNLFGGDRGEGGIVGTLKVMMGESTQKAPSALVSMLGRALPGFRRMMTCFYDGQTSSNSAYPKPWKFRVRRTTKGWQDNAPWYPEKAMILMQSDMFDTTPQIHAMNPAHIVYECMTNREWGRGLDASQLNIDSFTRAADTLFGEGFGLCLRWTRRDTLDSFVQSVLDHICAAMYIDRQTALLTLKLIRKDYEASSLPIYDTNSGILEITENQVTAFGPAVNEVVVEFNDPASADKRTKSAQNLASLQASRGVFNSIKKSYPGVPTQELAARIAQRDLRVNAMALRRFTIKMDRSAWRISPGDVIRISDVVRGVRDTVLRVGRVDDGTLKDGSITIVAVQDVFGLPETSYTGNQPPGGYKPVTKAELARHRAFEVPYFLLRSAMRPADFEHVGEETGYLGTVVEKPTPVSLGYTIYVKQGEPTPDDYPPTTP